MIRQTDTGHRGRSRRRAGARLLRTTLSSLQTARFLAVSLLTVVGGLTLRPAIAAEDALIDSMDKLSFNTPPQKVKVDLVEGRVGKAIRFSFEDDAKSAFSGLRLRPSAGWDRAAGISFWVKGDGSNHLGGLEFIWNEDYAQRYAYAFPISSTGWKKVTIPWSDLIPEVGSMTKLLSGPTGSHPSKLTQLAFGKWWYWKDYTAHSYTIDEIRLEPSIPGPTANLKPKGDPVARVRAKLKAGRSITIVTMGDSLTDYAHWSNRATNWPTLLRDKIRLKYGSTVTIVNPAMGGTELRQNMIVMPRWVAEVPAPDLVTIFFGPNDWNSGMRGEAYYQAQKDAIERIRRETDGKADVLIMTTRPPLEKGNDLSEMAAAGRRAAHDENAGLADIAAAYGPVPAAARTPFYAWDKVHLGLPGQELVAGAVLEALAPR